MAWGAQGKAGAVGPVSGIGVDPEEFVPALLAREIVADGVGVLGQPAATKSREQGVIESADLCEVTDPKVDGSKSIRCFLDPVTRWFLDSPYGRRYDSRRPLTRRCPDLVGGGALRRAVSDEFAP